MYGLVVMLTITTSKVHLTIPIVVQIEEKETENKDDCDYTLDDLLDDKLG